MLYQLSASAAQSRIRTVFVVDDEPAVRQFIRSVARGHECEILEFGDIPTATAALNTLTPDLIFLDLELGNGDAIEAFRSFAGQGYKGVIQLMSGRGEAVLEGVRAIGMRYGFDLLPPLGKPFRVRTIREVLDHVTAETSVEAAPMVEPTPATAPQLNITLEQALENGWLELWYQPKVDLRTGATTGAEGLIRARHPEHGVVAPYVFLPEASDQALAQLTERVILDALHDWQSFHAAGFPLQLCVNAPASALLAMPIASLVRQNRPKEVTWPGLVLELTEDQVLENIPRAQEIAAQLKIYDVGLSLDDFGQGHSSLARLRDLPFESLKIDRSFVSGCPADPAKLELCRTIVSMAQRFGCTVVAEGIETQAELDAIRDLGCEYGQGYLLGRPMTRGDLINKLVAARAS
jgi:EAL domain-containing protein (putative c-di-GMP-specific phosphodiesterase class I)/FixJ family two-component response regulator